MKASFPFKGFFFFVFPLLLCFIFISADITYSQTNQWTWQKGDSSKNNFGIYGISGISSANNKPGARSNAVSWVDADGNLWLFGGTGHAASGARGELNDLWKYNIITNEWTWLKGDSITNVSGIYGTQGIAALANKPGARWGSVSWTDKSGNLWLFGGKLFNDLWKYNIAANQWAWMKGSSTEGQPGSYGGGQTNTPGGRHNSVSWLDKTGSLWIFGGLGYSTSTVLEDLGEMWKYNISTNEWLTMNKGPRGRYEGVSWTDTSGNFWLFGGYNGGGGSTAGGRLNDLWKYDVSTGQWTFLKGDNTADVRGIYGVQNTSSITNKPGARTNSVSWTDNKNNLWLLGGFGYTASNSGYLNDLWTYNIATNEWTWAMGDSSPDGSGAYGSQGITSPLNMPPAKEESISWKDAAGNFWLFSGFRYYADNNSNFNYGYYNDLWKYTPVNALPITLLSFVANLQEHKIILQWIVENEMNFDRYNVERSNDGREFKKVGALKATGSKQYSLADDGQLTVDMAQPKLYYRLKMIDKDETFSYSKIVTVQLPSINKLNIYPNPATTSVQIYFNQNIKGKVDLKIIDATGKVIIRKSVEADRTVISLPTNELQAGSYTVKATFNGESCVQRLIVSK